ncbi:MAG: hypothetical protein II670_12670 [Alphaproteobacteria bacterium]|nr:hypothetical protein [Alphaproteobacteria bacterium]
MLNRFRNRVNISKENKVHFWSIFTTAIVGLFSLWLGVSIQDDINTKNAVETEKLARYQMVEAVYPKYEQFIDTCGYVFYDFLERAELPQNDSYTINNVGDYYRLEQTAVTEAMLNSTNFSCSSKFYFAKQSQEKICKNNVAILFGLRLLDRNNTFLYDILNRKNASMDKSIALELKSSYYTTNIIPYREQVEQEIGNKTNKLINLIKTHENDTNYIVNNIVYNFVFLPYINNFEIFLQELSAGSNNSKHTSQHILMFIACIIIGFCLCLIILRIVFGVKIFSPQKTTNNTPSEEMNLELKCKHSCEWQDWEDLSDGDWR